MDGFVDLEVRLVVGLLVIRREMEWVTAAREFGGEDGAWLRWLERRGSGRILRKEGIGRLVAETGWMDWTRVRLFI